MDISRKEDSYWIKYLGPTQDLCIPRIWEQFSLWWSTHFWTLLFPEELSEDCCKKKPRQQHKGGQGVEKSLFRMKVASAIITILIWCIIYLKHLFFCSRDKFTSTQTTKILIKNFITCIPPSQLGQLDHMPFQGSFTRTSNSVTIKRGRGKIITKFS